MASQTRFPLAALALSLPLLLAAGPAHAFCGFYVAKADARLFNKASKVVVARKGERTAVTMASDYEGDLKEFALVIPVPTVVAKEQIRIVESALVDHLDAYSAPRLVEYFDPDPCHLPPPVAVASAPMAAAQGGNGRRKSAAAHGVRIEAEYTIGEYDILILSATQSDGLARWLTESGYKMPAGAGPVLGSYIAILLARALYLGDPVAIPMKQMQSGALLLFTFFMITDPKTTPDRRSARMLFAVLVAAAGAWLQFAYYMPHGLMYALFFASPLVPLLDRLFPRDRPDVRFEWSRPILN